MELTTRILRFDSGGIFLDGCNASQFTYPQIAVTRFSSPLLNERNYELSGGGAWRDVLGRVTGGRKPVGFIDSGEPKKRAEYAASTRISAATPASASASASPPLPADERDRRTLRELAGFTAESMAADDPSECARRHISSADTRSRGTISEQVFYPGGFVAFLAHNIGG